MSAPHSTGKTGPFTSIGNEVGRNAFDTGEETTSSLFLPSRVPKKWSSKYPRSCEEANDYMHRICDFSGEFRPPSWNKGEKGRIVPANRSQPVFVVMCEEDEFCWEVRRRLNRARDCRLARHMQEEVCGKKGPNGKTDGIHQKPIDDIRLAERDNLKLWNDFDCARFL